MGGALAVCCPSAPGGEGRITPPGRVNGNTRARHARDAGANAAIFAMLPVREEDVAMVHATFHC